LIVVVTISLKRFHDCVEHYKQSDWGLVSGVADQKYEFRQGISRLRSVSTRLQ